MVCTGSYLVPTRSTAVILTATQRRVGRPERAGIAAFSGESGFVGQAANIRTIRSSRSHQLSTKPESRICLALTFFAKARVK